MLKLPSTINAALFDVDGTLLLKKYDGQIALPTQRVSDAVKKFGKRFKTGLATARQLQKVQNLIENMEMSGLSILSNGAQIYDSKSNGMVVERVLNKEIVLDILRELSKRDLYFWIQDNGIDHVINRDGDNTELREFNKLGQYRTEKPLMIVIHKISGEAKDSIINLFENNSELTAFTAHRHPDNSEDIFITDRKSNKKDALIELANILNIGTKEILAVGDGLNDIILMETCTGIAMGNAVQEVKDRAVFIAPPVDEDGVGVVLEDLLKS